MTNNPYSNEMPAQRPMAGVGNLLDLDIEEPSTAVYTKSPFEQQAQQPMSNASFDLVPSNVTDQLSQLGLGGSVGFSMQAGYAPPKQVFLSAASAKGMEIHGTFARRQGKMVMELSVTNRALQPIGDFAIQFNKNTYALLGYGSNVAHAVYSFGIMPGAPLELRSPLPPNQTAETTLILTLNPVTHSQPTTPVNNLHVAIKNNVGVFFFQTLLPLHILLREDGKIEQSEFLTLWQSNAATQMSTDIDGFIIDGVDTLRSKLSMNNVFIVAERQADGRVVLFCSARLSDNTPFMLEITAPIGNITNCHVNARSVIPGLIPVFFESLTGILRHR